MSKLIFLGTGHWRSRDREPTSLYFSSGGYNLLFECPPNMQELLEKNSLPKPDAIFTSSRQPHTYDERALREVRLPGVSAQTLKGCRIGPLSIKTSGTSFNVSKRDLNLLTYSPSSKPPNRFTQGVCCLVLGGILGDSLRTESPSVTQWTTVAQETYIVNIKEEMLLPNDYKSIRIPNDGEVITMSSGIYLHRPGLAAMVADGRLSSVIKSSAFEDYVNQPIFLCSEDGVHAKVILSEGKEISRSGFRDAAPSHGMPEFEAMELWPGFRNLYMFDVTVEEAYENPLEYNKPSSYRAFIEDVSVDVPEKQEELVEVIKKADNVIILYDKSGEKVLGRYPFGPDEEYKTEEEAREAAEEREKQVNQLKHMDEEEDIPVDVEESKTVMILSKDGTFRTLVASVKETTIEETGSKALLIEELEEENGS